MKRSLSIRFPLFALPLLVAAFAPWLAAQKTATYYPAPGQWQKKSPAELGMDAAKLEQAIEYAQAHGSTWDFEKDQVRTFGTVLGPLPKQRAATNGIILRHGYIVAEFGDTKANDPVYSVAKSFLSTVCSLAVAQGLIQNIIGNGSNTIWIDPDHDIVFVWHWYQGAAMDGMVKRTLAGVKGQ